MLDYIVVGIGVAGISFCEQLRKNNKTFVVYDNGSQYSSKVAGGLYNPVILKRFTMAWMAHEHIKEALPHYKSLELYLNCKLDESLSVCRKFSSIEEQNNWFLAADKPLLNKYLDTELVKNNNSSLITPFDLGKVKSTGRIDVNRLIDKYTKQLGNAYINESFQYDNLNIDEDLVNYKNLNAKKIVFCEGYGLKNNPYFNYLPLTGTKGELITIHAPDLQIAYVAKSSVFLIPLGDDLYQVGATYNWTDKTNSVSSEAKEELLEKLSTLINCDFTVVKQSAGIRPTVIDRRPLVGVHPEHSNVAVLNGLGTRGVILGPVAAKALYEHLEEGNLLDAAFDIKRFEN